MNTLHRHSLPRTLATALLSILLGFGCVSRNDEYRLFCFELDKSMPDTLNAMPQIICSLCSPVVDSTIALSISPAHPFIMLPNQTLDKITISFTQLLTPNQRYVLRPTASMRSQDGEIISAAEDSVVFFTADFIAEQEPNNSPATADTFARLAAGVLESATDTDFYLCTLSNAASLALSSWGSLATLAVQSSEGWLLAPKPGELHDTLRLPQLNAAVLIKVFAAQRSTGRGHYELHRF